VVGLLRYGFKDEARRIMSNSVQAHSAVFKEHATFFEKLNGVTGQPSIGYHYAMQQGFGWTNAAFYRYVHFLDALDNGQEIYKMPVPQEPPYDLAILS
jgi:neutral trehalase